MSPGTSTLLYTNVLGGILKRWSLDPVTGFYRNGYCQVRQDDMGNHSVAATLTDPFLDFTATRGNDLRSIGLKAGCKWCLCAARWREALDYARNRPDTFEDFIRNPVVPLVHLESTHISAYKCVTYQDLKTFSDDR
ncbi:hypothetical protein OnM2_096036 [Erysiphe neolycopersici]|uniref:Uncharacterized protein n=1 Tax=Erysiphe neolycopersici TaxID=212602 RepID=A0A420HB20_9PEZI|nr:hypothetical protein OnM2_096036 [Erysiphe neolycopersici]